MQKKGSGVVPVVRGILRPDGNSDSVGVLAVLSSNAIRWCLGNYYFAGNGKLRLASSAYVNVSDAQPCIERASRVIKENSGEVHIPIDTFYVHSCRPSRVGLRG